MDTPYQPSVSWDACDAGYVATDEGYGIEEPLKQGRSVSLTPVICTFSRKLCPRSSGGGWSQPSISLESEDPFSSVKARLRRPARSLGPSAPEIVAPTRA